jgi:hypothetical protein
MTFLKFFLHFTEQLPFRKAARSALRNYGEERIMEAISYCTFKISYCLLLDGGAPTVGTPLQIVPATHLEE